jgi:hypothetical protein
VQLIRRIIPTLIALVAAGALVGGSSGGTAAPLTGSLSITCSLNQCGNFYGWQCDRAVNLDSVTVTMDVPAGAKGKARDAVYLGQGCTGRIGNVVVYTNGGDGIKVAEGAHDVTVGGGTIDCDGPFADVHQDGIQVMGGSRITFTGLYVACDSANDAQFRVSMAGSATVPPDQIICMQCAFHPGPAAYHDVTVGISTNSGAVESTVCPSLSPGMVYDVSAATNPVNVNNTFPAAC